MFSAALTVPSNLGESFTDIGDCAGRLLAGVVAHVEGGGGVVL